MSAPTVSPATMTKKELAAVRKRVEALAEPLTFLCLIHLYRTRHERVEG